jgi:hypothetical protein
VRFHTIVLYFGALHLVACAHASRQQDDRCMPRPGEIYGSTADSLLGGIAVSSGAAGMHTERMLHPDPAVRTYNHLYGLRNMLRRFRENHGQLPTTIAEFSSPAPGIKWNFDGWGSSIRYTWHGDDKYELRAPGPDYALCTEDDMVLRNDTLPNRPEASDAPRPVGRAP